MANSLSIDAKKRRLDEHKFVSPSSKVGMKYNFITVSVDFEIKRTLFLLFFSSV